MTWVALSMQLSALLSVLFIGYVVVIVVPYLRRQPMPVGRSEDFIWHFFVPCRDEETVIGGTVDYLRDTFPGAHVWVIDDDSDDDTGAIVAGRADGDPRVHLVQRRRPLARTGKGDALNSAYRELLTHLGDSIDDPRVVVVVIDADGRPAANALDVCAGPDLFGSPDVGAVQIEVRMMNRDERTPMPGKGTVVNFLGRTLVRMQDIEFRTVIRAMQNTRRFTHSVGMGGNGQFTRLIALRSLDEGDGRAWRGSLLEDFELGLHLLLAGWRSEFTSDTLVDQEALFDIRRYLAQRTRWGQGVMQCTRYWSRIWQSNTIPNMGIVEITYFVMQPWVTLCGTLIHPIPLVVLLYGLTHYPGDVMDFFYQGGFALLAVYLIAGFGPFLIWGPIYAKRCEPGAGMWRGIGWGLAYSVYVVSIYVTSWRAFLRILSGRSGWAKTRRNAEVHITGPVAKEA